MIAAVRSDVSVNEPTLYVAFELGKRQWKLALTSGFGVAAMIRTVRSGDWAAVDHTVTVARRRFGLPAATVVTSCYEAGRDGFWIHRALVARGIANRVVDSSSIGGKRRRRWMKTDRIDALTHERTRLVNQLPSWLATMGATLPTRQAEGWWTQVRDWAADRLPGPLQDRNGPRA